MSGFRRLIIANVLNNNHLNLPLTLTAQTANSSVKLIKNGSPTVHGLQYRYGLSGEWLTYLIGTELSLIEIGDAVQFRNTETTLSNRYDNYVRFSMTGKIAASGNIMSMLNWRKDCYGYCFINLFKQCKSLTTPPLFPSTTLANDCYEYVFKNCSSLVSAPTLPATTVAHRCYYYMFDGCSSLTNAPDLPATTLANDCYLSMFGSCYSLTNAPDLPATTLAGNCYRSMFYNCSSLTNAPDLPATTLAGNCYYGMFQNCNNLHEIEVSFQEWPASGHYDMLDWVRGVASTGTFIKPSALPNTFGYSYIPTGWTVVNK